MRYRIYLTLTALLIVALTVAAVWHASPVVLITLGLAALVTLLLGIHAVIRPLEAVRNGICLLQSLDFGSRLRPTGQPDADRVIALFNRLMDTLKEERLRLMEQDRFLTKLIEVSPTGIAVCDFDGNVTETNPAYRRLCTPALDAHLTSLAPEEVRVIRLATSQIYRCSRLWFMDSGFQRAFYLIEPLTDDIIGSERNIFNIIVRTIGHEVANTLGSVGSVLDSLAGMHEGERVVTDAIRSSRTRCDHLLEFVSGYAGIVKLPAPVRQPVILADELRGMLPSLRSLAGDAVTVDLDISPEPHTLSLDMTLIERAIINIVKNSVESIAGSSDGREDIAELSDRRDIADGPDEQESISGGRITLSLDGATLRITDNGRGISPEASQRLFTPFFSTKRPDRGLGLMLTSEILRRHSARFSLTTDPSTHLTTFTIQFI